MPIIMNRKFSLYSVNAKLSESWFLEQWLGPTMGINFNIGINSENLKIMFVKNSLNINAFLGRGYDGSGHSRKTHQPCQKIKSTIYSCNCLLFCRECNSPCAGNNMMTCGGTDRIQVFGPPPGTAAIVHAGVQQKCEPWCITSTQSPVSIKHN